MVWEAEIWDCTGGFQKTFLGEVKIMKKTKKKQKSGAARSQAAYTSARLKS